VCAASRVTHAGQRSAASAQHPAARAGRRRPFLGPRARRARVRLLPCSS